MKTIGVVLSLVIGLLAPCARADYEPFRVTGLLKDVFRDPIDADYLFLYVEATNGAYYAVIKDPSMGPTNSNCNANIEASVGAQVSIALRKHLLKI